ncbi:LINE-1 retrotransposable element ORF1 protein [Plecturocebus cupreus]
MISARCNLLLLGSSDSPASVSPAAGVTGMHHQAWLILKSFTLLSRLECSGSIPTFCSLDLQQSSFLSPLKTSTGEAEVGRHLIPVVPDHPGEHSKTSSLKTVSFQAHEAVIHGHHPAPEENLQVLAALRLQYLQGDYTLHAAIPPLEEVYSLQRLKAHISQSTKTFTPCERLEKRRTSFLEGTLRRSFRTGSVVRQKVEEEQMLDMWIKEEVSSARASIIDKWKKFQGMNQEQAMAKYMALIKEWPGYGSTLFDVEVRTGVPECDGENESKLENTFQDIIQENFPNLASQANIQVQEIQRTPQRYSSRRATPRHIIIRFTRVEMKEKMLRAAREKGRVTPRGKPIRLTVDLSAETLQARREWGPIFNILKEKNFQPRISYPAKLSFISKGERKSFMDKQLLRDFITTRPALQELLKEALNKERNTQY